MRVKRYLQCGKTKAAYFLNTVQSTLFKLPGTYQICSSYEFALKIKCKYNGLSKDRISCLN